MFNINDLFSEQRDQIADLDQFVMQIAKVLGRRAERGWSGEYVSDSGCPAMFVLTPDIKTTYCILRSTLVIDLPVTNEPVCGRIYFLNRSAFNGSWIDIPKTYQPTDVLLWLSKWSHSEYPVILAYKDKLNLSENTVQFLVYQNSTDQYPQTYKVVFD